MLAAYDKFDAEIQAMADEIRAHRVIPACARLKLNFNSGMGMFGFSGRRCGKDVNITEDSWNQFGLMDLFETLNLRVYGDHELGFWVSGVDLAELK